MDSKKPPTIYFRVWYYPEDEFCQFETWEHEIFREKEFDDWATDFLNECPDFHFEQLGLDLDKAWQAIGTVEFRTYRSLDYEYGTEVDFTLQESAEFTKEHYELRFGNRLDFNQ